MSNRASKRIEGDVSILDGSVLEGGGQTVRNCMAYAALLGSNIKIINIRAGRAKGGLAQQVRRQHSELCQELTLLTAFEWHSTC